MKKRSIFKLKSTVYCVFAGSVVSLIFSVICLLILASVLVNYDIPKDTVKFLWLIVGVVGGITGGAFCGKFVKSKGILWGALSAVIVSILSVLIITFFNSFNISLFCLLLIPVYAFFGAAGGVAASNLR